MMHNRKKTLALLRQYDQKIQALRQIKKSNPSFVLASLLREYCEITVFSVYKYFKRHHRELTQRIFPTICDQVISPNVEIKNLRERLLELDDALTKLPNVNLNGDYFALLAVFFGYYPKEFDARLNRFDADSVLNKCWRLGQWYVNHQVTTSMMELQRAAYSNSLHKCVNLAAEKMAQDRFHHIHHNYFLGLRLCGELGVRDENVIRFLKDRFHLLKDSDHHIESFLIARALTQLGEFVATKAVVRSYRYILYKVNPKDQVDLINQMLMFSVKDVKHFQEWVVSIRECVNGFRHGDQYTEFKLAVSMLCDFFNRQHSSVIKIIILNQLFLLFNGFGAGFGFSNEDEQKAEFEFLFVMSKKGLLLNDYIDPVTIFDWLYHRYLINRMRLITFLFTSSSNIKTTMIGLIEKANNKQQMIDKLFDLIKHHPESSEAAAVFVFCLKVLKELKKLPPDVEQKSILILSNMCKDEHCPINIPGVNGIVLFDVDEKSKAALLDDVVDRMKSNWDDGWSEKLEIWPAYYAFFEKFSIEDCLKKRDLIYFFIDLVKEALPFSAERGHIQMLGMLCIKYPEYTDAIIDSILPHFSGPDAWVDFFECPAHPVRYALVENKIKNDPAAFVKRIEWLCENFETLYGCGGPEDFVGILKTLKKIGDNNEVLREKISDCGLRIIQNADRTYVERHFANIIPLLAFKNNKDKLVAIVSASNAELGEELQIRLGMVDSQKVEKLIGGLFTSDHRTYRSLLALIDVATPNASGSAIANCLIDKIDNKFYLANLNNVLFVFEKAISTISSLNEKEKLLTKLNVVMHKLEGNVAFIPCVALTLSLMKNIETQHILSYECKVELPEDVSHLIMRHNA